MSAATPEAAGPLRLRWRPDRRPDVGKTYERIAEDWLERLLHRPSLFRGISTATIPPDERMGFALAWRCLREAVDVLQAVDVDVTADRVERAAWTLLQARLRP